MPSSTLPTSSTAPSSTLPSSTPAFDSFGLPAAVVGALATQGITDPTPVQAAVLPDAMTGADVLGRARTGSGKTLAFGLPAIARLAGRRSRPCHPRALVIVPTRELATQVTSSLAPVAEAAGLKLTTVYGGTPYEKQTRQLRQKADLVVATPGRLEDLFEQGYVFFDDIEVTVLDEADHLCDLGFYPAVDKLIGLTPAGSQRMLLSATLDGDVDRLVRNHLRDPRRHELDPNAGAVTAMTHHTLIVGGYREKIRATADLIEANGRTIVFARTREGAEGLTEALEEAGVTAVDLHGNLSQRVRERNLARFSSGRAQAVVATDVAARGIHVDGVELVVHFDNAGDAKAYLHRSGRTARAGRSGGVVTITVPKQQQSVYRMQQQAGVTVRHHDVRSAPRPLTVAALDESGSLESPAAPSGRRPASKTVRGRGTGFARAGADRGERRRDGESRWSRDSRAGESRWNADGRRGPRRDRFASDQPAGAGRRAEGKGGRLQPRGSGRPAKRSW